MLAPAPARSAWRNRIVGHGDEDPSLLVANPRNWRLHPKHQSDALAGVLAEVGWVQEVTVNQRSGFVVDGHLRVALAASRNELAVPVRYVDLDDAEEALILATLDPIGALATADSDTLSALLQGLEPADEAVANLLRDLAPPRQKQLNPDDADLTPPDEPITQPGDLWLLGDHRLLCGDATNAGDVQALMDGHIAVAMLTDPPYGLGDKRLHDSGNKAGPHAADWDEETFDISLLPVRQHKTLIWGAQWFAGRPLELGLTTWSCWDKRSMYEGGDAWHSALELCCANFGKGTVWPIAWGPYQSMRQDIPHPTAKPLELIVETVRMATDAGELIYDPFLGSGTTVIAAEQLDRLCYGLEINPAYCDVIVRRWERVSGRQAVQTHP